MNTVNESFASKKQQRYFYAKSKDKNITKKEREKWKKMANEFSKETDFKKIPDKAQDVDEIVNSFGQINRSSKPGDIATKGVTSKSTTDKFARATMPQMGSFGVAGGTNTSRGLRYWTESDLSKSLGYDETLKKDKDLGDAKNYFKKTLKLSDDETEEKLEKLGYDEKLPKDKVRLVENPSKFIEEYLESILPKKTKQLDVVEKNNTEIKNLNPIIKKQILTLKKTMKNNGFTINDVIYYLKNE